jgi:hypothetical protein
VRVSDRTVRLKAYGLISDAVERGAAYGWLRAFKHTDKPTASAAAEAISNSVMSELCEVLEFEPDGKLIAVDVEPFNVH